eukprot:scaffold85530_cov100-Phaeocystis_antarctica.AAC.4
MAVARVPPVCPRLTTKPSSLCKTRGGRGWCSFESVGWAFVQESTNTAAANISEGFYTWRSAHEH